MAPRILLAVAALAPLAFAFENTFPVIAWSPRGSTALDRLPSSFTNSASFLQSILEDNDVCNHDAIVIFKQPGLHASDLRNLPSSCHLSKNLASARSSRQYPHAHGEFDTTTTVASLVEKCGARATTLTLGQPIPKLDTRSPLITEVTIPKLQGPSKEPRTLRRNVMEEHDSSISDVVTALLKDLPNALFIYTGQPASASLEKRQSPAAKPALKLADDKVELPTGGILKKYQLLTPGLITPLIILLFVLLPVLFVGLSALAGVQSSVRLEAPKDYSATAKKTQ